MSRPILYPELHDEPIMQLNDIDVSLTYSYANYLNWLFDDRVELIKGEIFKMSPAPLRMHQEISINLLNPFINFLKGKPCKVYNAPFNIRFLALKNIG